MTRLATVARQRRTALLAISLLVGILAGATGASATSSRATVTLHILNDAAWHGPGIAAVSPITAQKFGAALKMDLYPQQSAFESAVRIGLASNHRPDLFEWWFGYRMQELAATGHLVDLTPLWNKYIAQGAYTRAQMQLFSVNGKAYGVPLFLDYYGMFYNTHIFAKYHLTPPTTWHGLMALAATLKAHGVTPFGAGIGACSWCGFIWFEELLVRYDPALYHGLLAGQVKYTDPRVVHVMQIWKSMYDKGYFSNPGLTFPNGLASAFAKGQVAMELWGDWMGPIFVTQGLVPEQDFKLFVVPGMTPQGSRPLIVEARPLLLGQGAPNQAKALQVADYLMSQAGQTVWAQALHINATNLKVPSSTRPAYLVQLGQSVASGKYTLVTRYWEGGRPQITEAISSLMDKFMTQPKAYRQILSQAQGIADQYRQ